MLSSNPYWELMDGTDGESIKSSYRLAIDPHLLRFNHVQVSPRPHFPGCLRRRRPCGQVDEV